MFTWGGRGARTLILEIFGPQDRSHQEISRKIFLVRFQVKKKFQGAPGRLPIERNDLMTKVLQELLTVKTVNLHWLTEMQGGVEWELFHRSRKNVFLTAVP